MCGILDTEFDKASWDETVVSKGRFDGKSPKFLSFQTG